jgi:hypothetical protein
MHISLRSCLSDIISDDFQNNFLGTLETLNKGAPYQKNISSSLKLDHNLLPIIKQENAMAVTKHWQSMAFMF